MLPLALELSSILSRDLIFRLRPQDLEHLEVSKVKINVIVARTVHTLPNVDSFLLCILKSISP